MRLDDETAPRHRWTYWLTDRLIEHRRPILLLLMMITALLAQAAAHLRLASDLGERLPQSHPYGEVQRRYAGWMDGASSLAVMLEVKDGTVFTPSTLNKLWQLTAAIGALDGINPDHIESIAHRSARYLKVGAGGSMRSTAIMLGPVQTATEAAEIGRVVHNADDLYGRLVGLDDKALLIRAGLVEGRLDYGRISAAIDGLVAPLVDDATRVYVAGEPRLYGWVYRHGSGGLFILLGVYCLHFALGWIYFRDWRSALRATIAGAVAAVWGVGFIQLAGLAVDPLLLIILFLISARGISHAVLIEERYPQHLERTGWDQRSAIVATYGELFAPVAYGSGAGIAAVLAGLWAPLPAIQTVAMAAAGWMLAQAVVQMCLGPIVYSYMRVPEPELIARRAVGRLRVRLGGSARQGSARGHLLTAGLWFAVAALSVWLLRGLPIGDPDSTSPLLWPDSPYNLAQQRIGERFGGVDPLIIVAAGREPGAMQDPHTLRRMEQIQRRMQRDPAVGASFSLADTVRAVNMGFHELEPKWGVIPGRQVDVGDLLLLYFSGPPADSARYVDPTFTSAPLQFFCTGHQGNDVRRVVQHCRDLIAGAQIEDLGIDVVEQDGATLISGLRPEPGWQESGAAWVASTAVGEGGPFRVGDRIVKIGRSSVSDLDSLRAALAVEAGAGRLEIGLQRNGAALSSTVTPPWKAAFRLAGGVIGRLAAANQELRRIDMVMSLLAMAGTWVVLAIAFQSFAAPFYVLIPLLVSGLVVHASMAVAGIGLTIHTLPLLAVGLGLGIEYGVHIVSRTVDEMRRGGNLAEAQRAAWQSTAMPLAVTASIAVSGALLWMTSSLRFNVEMGGLLAIWLAVSGAAAQTLIAALIGLGKPRFILREAAHQASGGTQR